MTKRWLSAWTCSCQPCRPPSRFLGLGFFVGFFVPFLAIQFLFVSHFKKKIRASRGNLSNFVWGCSIANVFFGRNPAKSQRFDEWPWICRRRPILCTAWIDSQLRGSKSWEGRSVTMFSLKKPRKSGFSCFAEMFFNQFTVYVFFCNFVVEDGKTCCLWGGWRDYDLNTIS